MNLRDQIYFFPSTFLKVLVKHGPKDSVQFIKDYNLLRKEIKQKLLKTIEDYKIENPGLAHQKYLDVDFWVYESLRRVYFLRLHKSDKKLSVLDLGTGAGYFPYICKHYGHEAEAVDVPDNEMYNQVIKDLGIKRYTQYIKAYKDLDGPGKYDLITGFMICFNNHHRPDLWHINEWDYFLKSISKNNLNPGGNIFLSFNGESKEEPIKKDLLSFFSTNQGKINLCEISLARNNFYAE